MLVKRMRSALHIEPYQYSRSEAIDICFPSLINFNSELFDKMVEQVNAMIEAANW